MTEEQLPALARKQLEQIVAEKGSMHVVTPAQFNNPFYVSKKTEQDGEKAQDDDVTASKKAEENGGKTQEDDVTGAPTIPLMDAGMIENLVSKFGVLGLRLIVTLILRPARYLAIPRSYASQSSD